MELTVCLKIVRFLHKVHTIFIFLELVKDLLTGLHIPVRWGMSCMVGDSTCLLTEKTHLPSLIRTSHTASLSGQGKCISPRIKGLNWRIHSKKESQETEAGSIEAGWQRVRGTYYWIRMAWFYGHLGLRVYGLCCRLKTKGARCTEIWKQILIWSHYIQIFTVCTLLMVGTMATVDLAKLLVSRQQKCLALRSPGKLVILLLSPLIKVTVSILDQLSCVSLSKQDTATLGQKWQLVFTYIL